MRIAFLCGALEPGKDGVGDYVRQFARQLGNMGHQCMAIGVADSHINVEREETDPATGLETVRVPADRWAAGNIAIAERALRRFSPDWTSLQMVCYSYERRGLLLRSPGKFAKLHVGGKRHMMFHELWLGETDDFAWRSRAIGWLQKQLLLRSTRHWSADVVHTSNPLYREVLRRNGVLAQELPLPGNIAVQPIQFEVAREWLLGHLGCSEGPENRSYIVGVFGSIHPEWESAAWVQQLSDACSTLKRRLLVVQLGRAGQRGMEVWQRLQASCSRYAEFHSLGELAAAEISVVLQALDLGIATSPWPVAGKSGAIAAMLEHGLPVAVTRRDSNLRKGITPEPRRHPRLHRFDTELLARLRRGELQRTPPETSLAVYHAFIQSLEQAPNR